jgi:vacuolar protein sorting-associated protein 26
MAAYFFASPIDIDIRMEGEEGRKQVEIKSEKEKMIQCPVYYDGDTVQGQVGWYGGLCWTRKVDASSQVVVQVRDGKKITHDGIKVEFVGSIGNYDLWINYRIHKELISSCPTLTRAVLRSRPSPWIPVALTGARRARRDAPGADVWIFF